MRDNDLIVRPFVEVTKEEAAKTYPTEKDIEIAAIRAENERLRSLINYALDGPDDAIRTLLKDALDGVTGAADYHDIRSAREKVEAEVERLKARDSEWYVSMRTERARSLKAETERDEARRDLDIERNLHANTYGARDYAREAARVMADWISLKDSEGCAWVVIDSAVAAAVERHRSKP